MAQAYLWRGARLWFATRALVSLLLVLSGSNPREALGGSSIEIVALSVVLCFIDTRRRREDALIANLGVQRSMLATLFGLPAIAGEIALSLAASMMP